MNLKVCSRCGQEKSSGDFYRHKSHKDGFSSECKLCRKKDYELNKEKYRKTAINLYYKHRDKYLKRNRDNYNPETARNKWLKYEHGLSDEDWNKLFESQNGKCAICGIHQSVLKRKLCVDHNHYSQRVRGLLCDACNLGIGKLQVDEKFINLLIKAIDYLLETEND